MPNVTHVPESLPFPPDKEHGSLEYWRNQIKQSEEKRKRYKEEEWDRNIQSYLGKTLSVKPEHDTVTVPKDFANVERKKAELFFQIPDVNLQPKMPGLEDAVAIFQAVINHELGPAGVDAHALMTEVTFDACVSGLLVSKIGYESFQDGTVSLQAGEEPSPMPAQPGAILGLSGSSPSMQSLMHDVPNIVYERYFWQRISPARVLLPTDFTGFDYDRAPWLGYEFEDDWEVIKKKYNLAEDLKKPGGDSERALTLKSEKDSSVWTATNRVRGQEIWYRAANYDPAVVHPELLRYFILIHGLEEPVKHVNSPYQHLQQNTLQGMIGFPIHIGAVRYVSDTAYPASEMTIGRAQTDELGKSRTQMLLQRDRNVPMRLVDISRIGGEPGLDKLRRNIWQGIIPIQGLDVNQPPVLEVHKSAYPPEDFQFNSIISRDLDEVWAFGPNQRGLETTERKTATEIKNIQGNVSARLDYERRQIIRFYVGGARKLGSLIQLFADQQDYIQIVGQDGARRLQAWNKEAIQGEFIYDARPDSSVRIDAAQEFRDLIEMYNLTGKDPHANRVEILTKMARLKNLDTSRFIIPQLPPKGPEPARVSFAVKGENLDPTAPNFPILLEILRQTGYQISDQAIQQAQQHATIQGQIMSELAATAPPPGAVTPHGQPGPRGHGGPATPMEPINKHQAERTGQLTGPRTE